MTTPAPLTQEALAAAVEELAQRDDDLARVYDQFGVPPMWDRAPGFATLIHMILEQQVSLASAQAAFDRLCEAVDPLTPEGFLALDDGELRAVGFSRQKTSYGRYLAQRLLDGALDLAAMSALPDEEVHAKLCELKGIGPWTADIYLLMVLCRPDRWPIGDRALVVAAREVKGLSADPTPQEMTELGEAWRPFRSVAARLLWHHYLNTPRKR